ncbi:hypothetical protein [Amycolatopsis sp. VC5-11]|uniref:hypothetical protein n=1 Tax=Amycolatopsis sp. VC5-11 TaxID=3120156 RepID=UPI0030097EF9
MTYGEVVDLRPGQRLRAAFGVKYVADGVPDDASCEAVELILDGGPSVLLSADTDWTLRLIEGRWPTLPEWCWPVESWDFEKIPEIGSPGLDVIISKSEMLNAVGEICGVILEFPAALLTVSSGEAVTWSFSRKDG